jgi:hypothetical protein
MISVWRLARVDGAPARAGWLTILVLASAPVMRVIPFAVRPDMLGVSLESMGILVVLTALRRESPSSTMLIAAFACFGLAICIKQHFVAGPLVSICLLLAAGRGRQVPFRSIVASVLAASTIALLIYGMEELATGGRMSQSVFFAAASAVRVHPADWFGAGLVLIAIVVQSSGLVALLVASCAALVPLNAKFGRRALVATGASLAGLIFVLATVEFAVPQRSLGVYLLPAVLAAIFVVLPACAVREPRSLARGRFDAALWLYLAAELALMVVLCRSSTGAWVNYAIPSVVIASVLIGRVLDRALREATAPVRLIPIALAATALPLGTVTGARWSAIQRQNEGLALARVFSESGRPRSEYFFVGRPGENRACGRLDLVYDDWLYPVFESIHLAEPRSIWLRRALSAGTVRFIVNTSDSPQIDGVGGTLPQLGYSRRFQVGPFFVWERVLAARMPSAPGGRASSSSL